MREISRVYFGETGNEGKSTPQPMQHEVMNRLFQTGMRTSSGRLSRVYIGETGNEGKPRPQPLQREDMKQPFQTVQCSLTIPHTRYNSVSVRYVSWRCLNGLGPIRELDLRDCVPGTLDNGRRREKRHNRREYAIHPRVQCRQWWVEP